MTEESLINDIKEVNKLIPLEIELSQTIVIDDSWGDWDIFKKYKEITYTANCSYFIDLSNIVSDNINMNYTNKEITISIPKPDVYSIEINQDKTIYKEAVTGLLRFGDLDLSTEEYNVVEREIKDSITNNMKSDKLYNNACDKSKDAMTNLLKGLLGENLNATINFK